MKWSALWITLFGRTELWGLNLGFWISMAAVLLIVILMNLLFGSIKPTNHNHRLSEDVR